MANKVESLRSSAKSSMQALVDRALVQDEVSRNKKKIMLHGRSLLCVLVSLPFLWLSVTKSIEMIELHQAGDKSVSNFMIRQNLSYREMYAPKIWAKEKRVRPFESVQFGVGNY